jgi:hypothetical protein
MTVRADTGSRNFGLLESQSLLEKDCLLQASGRPRHEAELQIDKIAKEDELRIDSISKAAERRAMHNGVPRDGNEAPVK